MHEIKHFYRNQLKIIKKIPILFICEIRKIYVANQHMHYLQGKLKYSVPHN